jgi:hypothetical protein
MIEALVLLSDDRTVVGRFQFEVIPRTGEEFTIPWADDSSGVRIFDVDSVSHRAAGVAFDDDFLPGNVLLHVTEIL